MPNLHAYEALIREEKTGKLVLIDSVEEWKMNTEGEVLFQTGDIIEVKQREGDFKIGWVVNLAEREVITAKEKEMRFFVIGQDKDEVFPPADHRQCNKVHGLRKLFYLVQFGRMKRIK